MHNSAQEVITDLEFIFLGGTKLIHTLRESDHFEDNDGHYYLLWNDTGEDALIFKANLLQFGRRLRVETPVEQTAVAKVVADIKKAEAAAQGATSRIGPLAPAAPIQPTGSVVPADLRARSPLTR
jgi:hypothetical protein